MSIQRNYFIRILALVLMLAVVLPCVPALAASYTAVVTANSMDVYTNAYMTSKLGTLGKYTPVTVLATREGIAQMRYSGYTVYGNLDALTAVSEMAVKATVITNTRVFEKANTASRSAVLKAGTVVNLLAANGNSAMVEKNGVVGYTYLNCLQTEKNDFDVDTGNTGSSGNTGSTVVTGNRIEYNGTTVVIDKIDALVNVNSMTVYRSASASSAKLGTLSYGQAVTVRAYNASWAYIQLGGRFGFCPLASLVRAGGSSGSDDSYNDAVNKPSLENAIPATVTANSVKVYASSSTSSNSLGTLEKGSQVNVIRYNSVWAYIEFSGTYGYCAIRSLTRNSDLPDSGNSGSTGVTDPTATILGTATAVANTTMYATQSTNGTVVQALKVGASVNVHNYNSIWGLCTADGKTGYVPLKDLSPDSYAALEPGDSGEGVTTLENALLNLGYFDGKPGTSYNSSTTTAVERLQEACGMEVTGTADVNTLRVLYSGKVPVSPILSVTLKTGDENTNVKRMQERLYSLGYYSKSTSVDGEYGSNTAAAVKLFQTAAGISANGTANPATLKALYNVNAPTLPSGKNPADSASNSQTGTATGSGGNGHTTVMPAELASSTSSYSASSTNAQKLEYVIYVGQQQLGKPYVFASSGPNSFDCSGFTLYCFKKIGKSLPHSAMKQGYNESTGTKILDAVDLVRGDLVFFNTSSDSDLCDHVGIYLGSSRFIHAGSGAGKIVVSKLNSSYYSRVYSWGRRVLNT